MSDLISRADAIEAVRGLSVLVDDKDFPYFEDALKALPSADAVPQSEQYKKGFEDCKRAYEIELARSADANQNNGRLINADALMDLLKARKQFFVDAYGGSFHCMSEKDKARCDEIDACIASIVNAPTVSADAVQGWRIGKPTEQGKYMVTLDSFGHKHIDLFYYGKPMMPNRKVRGKCWYRSDDEWGDVVYDDTDILAWQPLPKPYTKGDNDEER